MSSKSHRWGLNPRPLGSAKRSNQQVRSGLALVRADESGEAAPNTARTSERDDSYTASDAFPRPLGVVSRGIAQGWRYAHVDLVPPDGPRAA